MANEEEKEMKKDNILLMPQVKRRHHWRNGVMEYFKTSLTRFSTFLLFILKVRAGWRSSSAVGVFPWKQRPAPPTQNKQVTLGYPGLLWAGNRCPVTVLALVNDFRAPQAAEAHFLYSTFGVSRTLNRRCYSVCRCCLTPSLNVKFEYPHQGSLLRSEDRHCVASFWGEECCFCSSQSRTLIRFVQFATLGAPLLHCHPSSLSAWTWSATGRRGRCGGRSGSSPSWTSRSTPASSTAASAN